MAKLSLTASPTFTATVLIPVQGKRPAPVEFTFRHKTRDALAEIIDGLANRKVEDFLMDIVVAWDLDDEFCREAVETLLQNYPGAGGVIRDKYFAEMIGAKSGN